MQPTTVLRVASRRILRVPRTLSLCQTPLALSSTRCTFAAPTLKSSPPRQPFSHRAPALSANSSSNGGALKYKIVDLAEREYHELSDEYLELLLAKYEDLQEERDEVDVEFAAGVMTIFIPMAGTYVINKQPPNKQIWLSSPISGPKRYDYVEITDSKSGTKTYDWLYLRDNSSLHDLLLEETSVDLGKPKSMS
ncbi:hypothetical protein jhhlp_005630 [Lomentospora prolificans]|uniref:ferroxidase n=1 Tax=Lomentospora prolificans TaxID=41688 RepID=A0A2N3N3N0_9PEZI|nr:hypothetical protein jhhlp_005630 [Lomentospora prolificans]